MKHWPILLLSVALFIACKQEPQQKTTEEIIELFPNDSLNANDSSRMDSLSLTTIKFGKEVYDFGEIQEGEVIKNKIDYQNTGKHPLVLEQVYGSCGCTVANFSKEPIEPGEKGEIEVEFNSKGRPGAHTKSVIVHANTIPPVSNVNFSVKVNPKKKS